MTVNTPVLSRTQQRAAYLDRLLTLAQQSPPSQPWVSELRNAAAARLGDQTFPSTRDEEWRFTDLAPLLAIELATPAPAPAFVDLSELALPEASHRLVFIDGHYAPTLSLTADLPDRVVLGSLADLPNPERWQAYLGQQAGAEEVFTELNTAGLKDAAVLWIPKNAVVESPIHLLFLSTAGATPALVQPRVVIVSEANSAATVVEEYGAIGTGAYFVNPVTEIWVAENAQLHHHRIQRDSGAAVHIGKTAIAQARTARYTNNSFSFGARLARHHLEIYQTGEQTETILNGLMLIGQKQLSDLHSTIALTHPHGVTRQLQKCIVDDQAHAVFNGKVFVPQAAQLTDAGQLNRNLLLSSQARVDTKPQLEIVADNVKCTHGAAIGQLDTDEVFYLQSRGIDADSARNLLIYGFAYEIIEQVPIASLQQRLAHWVSHRSA